MRVQKMKKKNHAVKIIKHVQKQILNYVVRRCTERERSLYSGKINFELDPRMYIVTCLPIRIDDKMYRMFWET